MLAATFSILPAGMVRAASKLRIGVIGSGAWGLQYLSLAAQHPDVSVRALCEPDADRRRQALSLCALPPDVYTHWQQLIACPHIDAVLIATPWQWHGVMALAALKAGKHVLCGTVAATTPEGHDALLRASFESGRQYITLNETDFHPDQLAVGAMVKEGLFGDIHEVRTGVHCAQLPGDMYALQGASSVLSMLGVNAENPFTRLSLRREKMECLVNRKDRRGVDQLVLARQELPVMEVVTAKQQTLVLQMPHPRKSVVAIGFQLKGSEGRWLEGPRVLQRTAALPQHHWEPGRPYLEQYRNDGNVAETVFGHAVASLQAERGAAPTVYDAIALSRLQAVARRAARQGQDAVELQAWGIV